MTQLIKSSIDCDRITHRTILRLGLSLVALGFVLLCNPNAFAGTSGKVSGSVVDATSGEPIVGATVRVNGTNIGTKTDTDGEYFIIDLPVGTYNVTVSTVGFETVTKSDVRVLIDLTTPVDFELAEQAVELGRNVIVTAEQPVIQRDLTSSRLILTSERLKNLPNVISVRNILSHYPGVVIDRDEDIHVRGGRSGQLAYSLDGFSIEDPFVATSGLHIMPDALEELSLTSGGYSAEYGNALSGVVSAVTREGGPEYHGMVKTYESATHTYDVTRGDWGGITRHGDRGLTFNLSGPLPGFDPKKMTFFSAGEYRRAVSSLPNDWGIGYTGILKMTMRPLNQLKLRSNVTFHSADGRVYNHRDVNGRSYDFNLDGLPKFGKESYLVGLTGTYYFSEASMIAMTVNRFSTMTKTAPPHLYDLYWNQWPGYSVDANGNYNGTIDDDNYHNNPDFSDPFEATGFTSGDDFYPTYHRREAAYNAAKLSFINQVNKSHQLEAGLELRKYSLDWDFKQFFNNNPYGEKYSSAPLNASFFLQDKMEYKSFVINVGLRLDYRDADISYNATPEDTVIAWEEADSKTRLSPRFGISFPISEKSVMHFNYGVYYQAPRFQYMYLNLQGDVSTGLPLLGNPNLDPEQTVSYELGLDHLVGSSLRIDATAYYKDVKELVTTRNYGSAGPTGSSITLFTNEDYGSVQGFDLSLEKLRADGYLTGSISYGYMIATGNGSDALEPYYTYLTDPENETAPVTEYPLDFDQRHTITAIADFRVPADWRGNLYGMPVPGDWGLSMVARYGSGLPYTRTDEQGNRIGDRNSSRLPASYTVDVRLNKDFQMGPDKFTIFAEIENLFNRRNILNVYTRTGQADSDGNSIGAGLSLDADQLRTADRLYDHDPQNFSAPRTVRLGAQYSF